MWITALLVDNCLFVNNCFIYWLIVKLSKNSLVCWSITESRLFNDFDSQICLKIDWSIDWHSCYLKTVWKLCYILRKMFQTTLLLTTWSHTRMFHDILVFAKEYCQLENFEASCSEGTVILMEHAQYGRMRINRCLTRDYYVGCTADVIAQLDQKCSGRRHCHVTVPDHTLLQALSCPKDLVAYLEADFTCIRGTSIIISSDRYKYIRYFNRHLFGTFSS